eukprot:m51a1_g13717 putative family hydrolase (269) ;mRNA; r:99660-100720
MSRGWVDSHCHMELLAAGPEQAFLAARAAGVERVCAVAESRSGWPAIAALRAAHAGAVAAGFALHPCPDDCPALCDQLAPGDVRRAMDDAAALAPDVIGECGLDYFWGKTAEQKERQRALLDAHLELAERTRRPLNLHSRRSARDVLSVAAAFRRRTGVGAALHWFTHSRKLLAEAVRAGLYVSVGPSIEYDEDDRSAVLRGLQDVGVAQGLRQVLLETDGPVKFRGVEAAPEWIPRVGAALAALLGISANDLRDQVAVNYDRYLANQ